MSDRDNFRSAMRSIITAEKHLGVLVTVAGFRDDPMMPCSETKARIRRAKAHLDDARKSAGGIKDKNLTVTSTSGRTVSYQQLATDILDAGTELTALAQAVSQRCDNPYGAN